MQSKDTLGGHKNARNMISGVKPPSSFHRYQNQTHQVTGALIWIGGKAGFLSQNLTNLIYVMKLI